MPSLYFPGADTRTQNYAAAFGGTPQNPNVLVLHTTESSGWPDYRGGKSAPHMTGRVDFSARRIEWRGHYPANRSSRALARPDGSQPTNTRAPGVYQIELIGTSGWASAANRAAPYVAAPVWSDLPEWVWMDLARVVAWLHTDWSLPLSAIRPELHPWTGGPRMGPDAWRRFAGICGHSDVPYQTHTDPGRIPVGRIVEHARALLEASQEDDMTPQQSAQLADIQGRQIPLIAAQIAALSAAVAALTAGGGLDDAALRAAAEAGAREVLGDLGERAQEG